MPLKVFKEKETKPPSPLDEVRHIIAVAAGKGGVGKSSLTVNLALALQKLGYRVGILDADLYGPSLQQMLPLERPPKQQGSSIFPALAHGMPLISMAYFRKEGEATAVRAPIANGIIQQFLRDVVWGSLDYLLIDCPPGTGDIQLTLAQKANLTGAIVVTTPQKVALLDVQKAIHLFKQVQVPILGIVENMSGLKQADGSLIYPFGKGGGKALADQFQVPFLGEIPLDPAICAANDNGTSLLATDSPTADVFLHVAQELAQLTKAAPATAGFELKWNSFS